MSSAKSVSAFTFSLTLIANFFVVVSSDGLDPTISAPSDKLEGIVALNPAAASNLTVFRVATDSILTLNLLSSLPKDQEISVYCRQVLGIFRQRYVASIDCLVPAARPVKVCQNCFSAYGNLQDIYKNISSDQVCCRKRHINFLSLSGLHSSWMVPGSFGCLRCLMITSLVMLLHVCGDISGNKNSTVWLHFSSMVTLYSSNT